MARNAIGIDIGGTKIRAARVAPDGTVEAVTNAPTDRSPAGCLAQCLSLVRDLRDDGTVAIGAGVPGQVDHAAQKVLSGGFVDLSAIPFAARLADETGLPVTIDNDGNMALQGEARAGAARGLANVVLLTIGTGIGGAMLENGRILRGKGTAGQLGHLPVIPDGRPCVCGRRGCVETESSGTAFGTHLAEAGLAPSLRAEDLLARQATNAAARAVLLRWATPLRAAIESLITTVAPDAVVLGGGAGPAALKALDLVPAPPSWFDAPLRGAALGADAGVVGAALAAMPQGRRLVMVNGVPASGKSSVAAELARVTGWPVLSLDTMKNPFLTEFGPVDRPTNRRFGAATYRAIFDMIAQFAPDATVIVDAWFGFQPAAVLVEGLERAGVTATVELWCHAAPEVIGTRYEARAGSRPQGHPGVEYVPELVRLAAAASPVRIGPVIPVDTTYPIVGDHLQGAAMRAFASASP
jgi:glucokinase